MNNLKLLFSSSYNAFESEKFNGSGVYMIKGLIPSERLNNTIYIGSAVNLKRRIYSEHLPRLRKNKHSNKILQNYYNRYGIENIEISLLEICNIEETVIKEQYYLDLYRPFSDENNGFNICKFSQAFSKGCKWNIGRTVSDETKLKMSKARMGIIITEDTRKKLSIAKSKENHPLWGKKKSKESIEKSVEGSVKHFKLISPNGLIIEGKNIRLFSDDNNLDPSAITKLMKGKLKSHKGWKKPPTS